jgi:hypothetical protein
VRWQRSRYLFAYPSRALGKDRADVTDSAHLRDRTMFALPPTGREAPRLALSFLPNKGSIQEMRRSQISDRTAPFSPGNNANSPSARYQPLRSIVPGTMHDLIHLTGIGAGAHNKTGENMQTTQQQDNPHDFREITSGVPHSRSITSDHEASFRVIETADLIPLWWREDRGSCSLLKGISLTSDQGSVFVPSGLGTILIPGGVRLSGDLYIGANTVVRTTDVEVGDVLCCCGTLHVDYEIECGSFLLGGALLHNNGEANMSLFEW